MVKLDLWHEPSTSLNNSKSNLAAFSFSSDIHIVDGEDDEMVKDAGDLSDSDKNSCQEEV